MQKITIANVDSKTGTSDKGPWTKTTITGLDGLKASGFDPGLANLKPGTTIEAEIEVKGKFTNIGKFTIVSQAPPSEAKPTAPPNSKPFDQTQGKPAYGTRSPEERASIEKQVALKELGEMIRAGKADDMLPLWTAAIRHMIGISDTTTGATLALVKVPAMGAIEPPPVFESPTNLVNYWMQHGFSWLDIQAALNIKAPADIKDLKNANETLAKIRAAQTNAPNQP